MFINVVSVDFRTGVIQEDLETDSGLSYSAVDITKMMYLTIYRL